MGRLTSATGASTADDATDAGRQAAEEALGRLDGAEPSLVLVYASVRYDLDALLAGIRGVTGSARLVGSTSAGHFAGGTAMAPAEGVVVLLLAGGSYRFGVGSASGLLTDPERTGVEAARTAKDASHAGSDADDTDLPYAAVILLTATLMGDPQKVLAGVHRIAGAAVPVVGAVAADDREMSRPCVLHDDQVLPDAAVAVWIRSPSTIGLCFIASAISR